MKLKSLIPLIFSLLFCSLVFAAEAPTSAAERLKLYQADHNSLYGNPHGDVTITEFFDYNCPHCRDEVSVLEKLVAQDPGVRIVFKEAPFFGRRSLDVTKAALAAHTQGKYFIFHNALLKAHGQHNLQNILDTAKSTGLDEQRLLSDMDSLTVKAAMVRNYNLAQRLNITGVPVFYIANTQYALGKHKAAHQVILEGEQNVAALKAAIADVRQQ